MWEGLDVHKKEKYKSLITNFASLSEAFSQKSDNEFDTEIAERVAPIVNSKFQETAFQRSFGAIGEDIANTSYDASLNLNDKHKYLVGIKSFGIHSGDQKIAQFKASSISNGWSMILAEARKNADLLGDKNLADEKNEPLYRKVAIEIAQLRNERIASSKELIKGFDACNDVNVDAVYHVLMPSKRGEMPQIHVGETSYLPIDIDNVVILGATSIRNATNFKFTDGRHTYKYADADSQLFMNFHNREIVVDTWDVSYVQDAFAFFENLHEDTIKLPETKPLGQTVSWMIANEKGIVEESSGYNGFDGATKLAKANNYRENRIGSFYESFKNILAKDDMNIIISYLKEILLKDYPTKEDKREMKRVRNKLKGKLISIGNEKVKTDIFSMVYRPVTEMYIPIPESRKFHDENPDFFGENIGTFKNGTQKLALDKEQRTFTLEFIPSGNKVLAYVNQDNGKGIQSKNKQGILGEWILRGVFQLDEYEILTGERLDELGINAIRLTKFDDSNRGIGLEFIWIDIDNPPADAIGWVSKNKK
ncbi:hypothetical protein K5E_23910 [Enterococcus thailandicus]|uniref:hypothetical protein n=1 Tax=Enterococcus thailandicus TaxID=417368 RepID=UPI00244D82AB|nr:hypothetical protein [Enterococcus thailandicus]GMC03605.1 hypothetical protein K4E_11270 [Enterococcus thailandicus]GMC10252.1 hypothetical protein K5E_23910 [Enterococcus thailandicus]